MTGSRQNNPSRSSLDWRAVGIYALLALMGWVNLYAAVYNPEHPAIFDLSQRYGMQLVWMAVGLCIATTIMLIDGKYHHMFAYPLYWGSMILLAVTLVFGREVNGAKAWLFIGGQGIQPAEFVKFTASLAVARYMSRYDFSVHRFGELLRMTMFILLPVAIILLQNDTGSAVVYGAFLFMLYREGLNGWIYVALILAVALFVVSFLLTPATIIIVLILLGAMAAGVMTGHWRGKMIFLAAIALGVVSLYFGSRLFPGEGISLLAALLAVSVAGLAYTVYYIYRTRLHRIYILIVLFVCSLGITSTVDYVFDNVLQTHQQKRILDLLGIESDTRHWGYNVNQSKIAIGSGGFMGKGFLNGTQTRYDFVPEQSTDFIFCTVGEEWGFVGATIVVLLFGLLIIRLMKMGERQREPFGRIYCYCVAAIFFVHVFINVGMTIGIMPVIGIPLPLFSYGGSSFVTFTILFFVAVRLDSGKRELLRN